MTKEYAARVAIVAVEGSLHSSITGLADLFWITGQAMREPPPGTLPSLKGRNAPTFETVIVSLDGQAVRDAQGRLIHVR
ncbi:hypothetical protein FHX57_006360 [Paraburkholderia tropica]|uniref:hypothetical protein n=1 Tax=Paraburkholderia tropica TaxID=92647 RepID=UPI00183159C4|nr:hypothetical protein [Paraburkholderia tropica]MBB3003981.1 hypothetical protein [Paraburkholderia tropica]MBB6323423.1 hypothetical protein [Paraburkholderia tropica]